MCEVSLGTHTYKDRSSTCAVEVVQQIWCVDLPSHVA